MKPRFILICAFVFLASVLCFAQSQLGTGAISGTVTDPSGQVVADAAVTVTSADTGLVRKVNTSGAGLFNILVLPPGVYDIRVEKTGFSTTEQKGVQVNVGGTATLQLKLQIGAVQSVVNVTAEAPEIETTRTAETSLVSQEQIRDLPNNGRRYDQFALLVPGVTRDGSYGLLAYRGISGVFNNFTVDGNDDNSAYYGSARGYTRIASSISANAIQEFQVGKSNFLPEFGRTAGGNINTVVRSGSNRFHFDGFEYFKNSALSARDPLASIKPDETRHQFGGSISGPIKKDKIFYFVNYDQQLRDFPVDIEDNNHQLTNCKPTTQADQAACDAAIAFMKTKFPGGGPGHTLPRTFNQNLALAKLDYLLSSRNSLSFTYNYLNHRAMNGVQTAQVMNYVANNGQDNVRGHTFNTRLTSTLSATLINEARFQYSLDSEFQNPGDTSGPLVMVGATSISSSFAWGQSTYLPRAKYPEENKQQVVDNLSVVRGAHNFKFGGEMVRANDTLDYNQNYTGQYIYSTVLSFGQDLLNPAGKKYYNFQQGFGLSGVAFTTFDYAAYAQDQWKITRNLTLNYGLRWDFQRLPDPQYPNPAVPETTKFNQDHKDFGPRVDFAWDILGTGKTVVRGGYGMMYARTPNGGISDALRQTGLLDPTKAVINFTIRPTDTGSPVYPNILSNMPSTTASTSSPVRLDPNYVRPRVQEVNIGVDHQLGLGVVLSVSYVYTKGSRFPIAYDVNSIAPNFTRTFVFPDGLQMQVPFTAGMTKTASGQTLASNGSASRPNPNFGYINVFRSIGENWYNGALVEVKRRFSHGFMFNVSYTLAKAENYGGTGSGYGGGSETYYGGPYVWDQFDLKSNRGIAPTDQRHRMVTNLAWSLPFKSDNNLVNRLIHGYQFSSIITLETGRPYASGMSSVYLPFTAADGSQWTSLGGAANGQGGLYIAPGLARNGFYGDPNYKIDLRVSRTLRLNERFQVELLGEGSNIFNHSNFNQYYTTAYTATASKVTDPVSKPILLTADRRFGAPTGDGVPPDGTGARRFQLSARFRF